METTSETEPSYRVLRLMCGNAVGMVAFVTAYVLAGEIAVAAIAGVLLGAVGYVASSAVADYAAAGAR